MDLNKSVDRPQDQTINNMPKRVVVLCRYNQARSIIAASILESLFPLAHFSSGGINAVDGDQIPESIIRIAEEWGIHLNSDCSKSLLAARSELSEANLVIIAETELLNEIPSGYLDGKPVLSMQDSRFSPQFIPFDPINASPSQIKSELAKTIMTSVQLVAQNGLRTYENEVSAYIPESVESFETNSIHVWNHAKDRGANLLVADFRAPNPTMVNQMGAKIRKITKLNHSGSEGLVLSSLSSEAPYVVTSQYEIDNVESFALSINLQQIINELSRERELIILTGPLTVGTLSFVDPFLIASHATRCISLSPKELDT